MDRDRATVEGLAGELARINRRLDRLEAGGRSVQLASSSIEDGAVDAYDADGTLRQILGLHTDGTFAVTYAEGPQPPAPSPPTLIATELGLVVYWNGEFEDGVDRPADVERVDIHEAESPLIYINGSTIRSSLPGEGARLLVLDNQEHFIRLVAVTTSGVASEPSEMVSKTPLLVSNLGVITLDAATIYIPTDDPNVPHLEIGDANKPIWFGKEDNPSFVLSYDETAERANTFVSGRMVFGKGSELSNDYVELAARDAAGYQSPTLRQTVTSGTDFNRGLENVRRAFWSMSPSQDNTVLAVVAASSTEPPLITPTDSTWQLVATATEATGQQRISLFMIAGPISREGGEEFNFNPASLSTIQLIEYEGLTDDPLDQVATDAGSGTTASTGTTEITTQDAELWFGALTHSNRPISGLSGGFSEINSSHAHRVSNDARRDYTVSAGLVTAEIGQANLTGTVENTDGWAGIIATFKLRLNTPQPQQPENRVVRMFARDVAGATTPHAIDDTGRVWSMGPSLIQEIMLETPSGGEAGQLVFPDIPQDARHLELVCYGGINRSGITEAALRFNGDNSSSYYWMRWQRDTTSAVTAPQASGVSLIRPFAWGGNVHTRNTARILIPNYTDADWHATQCEYTGVGDIAGSRIIGSSEGEYRVEAPVTRIDLFVIGTGNLFREQGVFSLHRKF